MYFSADSADRVRELILALFASCLIAIIAGAGTEALLAFGAVLVVFSVGSFIYFRFLWKPSLPLKIISTEVTVNLIDSQGKKVIYKKKRKMKALTKGAKEFVEPLSADGSICDFEVDKGDIGTIRGSAGAGMIFVPTLFEHPLKRGEVYEQTFGCSFLNSFTKSNEYCGQRVYYHTDMMRIKLIFPLDRKVKTYNAERRYGIKIWREDKGLSKCVENGHDVIIWEIDKPLFMHNYNIYWTW